MQTFEVLAVNVRVGRGDLLEERKAEVERYLYGRFFFLDFKETNESTRRYGAVYDLFYLVETHYAASIIPRLASGLLWCRNATADEMYELGLM